MDPMTVKRIAKLSQTACDKFSLVYSLARISNSNKTKSQQYFWIERHAPAECKRRTATWTVVERISKATRASNKISDNLRVSNKALSQRVQLFQAVPGKHQSNHRKNFGEPSLPSKRNCDSSSTSTKFVHGSLYGDAPYTQLSPDLIAIWRRSSNFDGAFSTRNEHKEKCFRKTQGDPISTFSSNRFTEKGSTAFKRNLDLPSTSKHRSSSIAKRTVEQRSPQTSSNYLLEKTDSSTRKLRDRLTEVEASIFRSSDCAVGQRAYNVDLHDSKILMTSASSKTAPEANPDPAPAQHRPLVVGLTKPSPRSSAMTSSETAAALNHEIEKNLAANTKSAAPAEDNTAESSQPKQKKEKAAKQPKAPKAAPASAPTSPALIDLRVGHILRAIAHPNADSLYVSTIAMGDPEGTEHTQIDEETGKVVRTVCSGLNGLVPLAEMQDRKIIVVANLKPVNMRSIKSAAMVLAASPKQEEGADPHAPDRVVELVMPPEGSEAGDKVCFEGWPYGEGKGPEKQLNPKKKQWESIQPGFYTSDDLVVGFDASRCEEVSGSEKGQLVVEGKGACTVKTLKGAVVR